MSWDDLHARSRYSKWPAYGQSKLANLLFMRELDRRAREHGSSLRSMAAHPGYASTHLQAVGAEMTGNRLSARTMDLGNRIFAQSDAEGAWPQLYAATMPDVQGGDYYGPSGLFEMHGSPEKVSMSRRARTDADARRLWEVSEKETGVTYDWK